MKSFCEKHMRDNSDQKHGICPDCVNEKQQWDGEGLPPVGTVCEWLASVDHDWVKVTVLGHHGDDIWLKPDDGTQSFIVGNAENFRPIPKEREKDIDEILQIINHNGVDPLNSAKTNL